jgi:hypothetical protein
MEANTLQGGNSERQRRLLKVEAIGDPWRGRIIPRIRIAGQWLERAGFKPDNRVEVVIGHPGKIMLRFVQAGKETAL